MEERRRFSGGTLAAVAIAAALAAAGVAALLVTIFERKVEGRTMTFRVAELDDETTDPAVWGRNYPVQYDMYRRTVDQVRTRYGGSEAVPHTPTGADPRSIVAQSRLEEDPRLRTIWAGYAFAKDFREERGHAYMLEDQLFTERQVAAKQPGTCLHCHASVYVPYRKAGGGDLVAGFEKVNQMPYAEAVKLVEHPVSCIDCHDPATMALRVTRPGFLEGIRKVKAAEGVAGYDVNRDATRQEMRTFVCGQCHVEYYFKGPEKRLTYPWDRGLTADAIYEYYQDSGFKDWQHAITGAPALKAQHPEFETFNQGTHARAGVACADCHMPYRRIGAQKVSDHQVRSPLLMVDAACQTCHRVSEDALRARVHGIQERVFEMRNRAMDAVVRLIGDIDGARKTGRTDQELAAALELHRRSQFFLDFVEAENSTGFHAPQEALRILGLAIDAARQGQVALRDPAFQPVPWSRAAAAQQVRPAPEAAVAEPASASPPGGG